MHRTMTGYQYCAPRWKGYVVMNSVGCGLLLMTVASLLVGFVPFMTWINWILTLPLALIAAIVTLRTYHRYGYQPADGAALGLACAMAIGVVVRMALL